MAVQTAPAGLEYVRRVYDRVLAWYESAERKAQLVLTLDGVFLSFVTGSLLSKPDELQPILAEFGPETWVLAGGTLTALLASIACAVGCLWSRLYNERELRAEYDKSPGGREHPGPDVLWFFQFVAGLESARVAEALRAITSEEFERDALAGSVAPLAKNVVRKHRLVNFGFLLAGAVLALFLLTGVSYVLRVA